MSLNVKLGRLRLYNPTVLASGILGVTNTQLIRVAESGIGALTTKSFTFEAREGYKTPIVAYVKCGLINAVGLSNPGYKNMDRVLRDVKRYGIPVIVSIAGSKSDEFSLIASYAEEVGADAVELNLSCPHTIGLGLSIGDDPNYVGEIVSEVSSVISIPVYIKIGLHQDVMKTVDKALGRGAEGVTAINTVKAMAIDIYAKKPILSNIYGGLSGPAIHPIAVKIVYDIYHEYRIPIIGVGGVSTWDDAVEFLLAGASAVGIGTAIAEKGLEVIKEIIDGIERYLEEEGFRDISEIIGYVHS